MDLGVITMKKYSKIPRAPELKLHQQMQFSVIPKILNERFVVRLSGRDKVTLQVNFSDWKTVKLKSNSW